MEERAITLTTSFAPAETVPRQPRAIGALRVSSKRLGERSVIGDLYQSGASKLLWPRTAQGLTGVMLNTAGGVTGGDRFEIEARAGVGSRLTLTTQAAERIYRAQPGEVGSIRTRLTVEAGGRIDWLPQETILFDHSALRRSLSAELARDARLLLVEPVIFGRIAMGEETREGLFHDRIEIRREGALVFADATRLGGAIAAHLDAGPIAGGARALATLVFAAPDAERLLAPLRALLPPTGGASLIRPGLLFARMVAPDSYLLRQSLLPVIELLQDAPIPRTWTI